MTGVGVIRHQIFCWSYPKYDFPDGADEGPLYTLDTSLGAGQTFLKPLDRYLDDTLRPETIYPGKESGIVWFFKRLFGLAPKPYFAVFLNGEEGPILRASLSETKVERFLELMDQLQEAHEEGCPIEGLYPDFPTSLLNIVQPVLRKERPIDFKRILTAVYSAC